MPPRGKLHLGSNIGIDKEQAYKDKIADLQKNQIRDVPLLLIDEIENVRKCYDQNSIEQLAASIKEKGLLQPVILSEQGTRYGIQAGHRRVLAFRLLERETIPALIRPSPECLAEIQLIENIQREDLAPGDLELAVKSLVERHGSQERVAAILLKSKQWVSNILAASRVRESLGPALDDQGVKDTIPSGHLRDIAALPPAEQAQATKEALAQGGGKRAFRRAAQKARRAQGSPDSQAKPARLLSFILTATKQDDGTVDVKTETTGEPGEEAKARFDAFCEEIETLLSKGEHVGP